MAGALSSYLTFGQSCALNPALVSPSTLEQCNSTYISVLSGFLCVCETCREPYHVASGMKEGRFCHFIQHCRRMIQCNDCRAPWNLACDVCETGYLPSSSSPWLCEPKQRWHWYGPLRWIAGLFHPARLALPPPQTKVRSQAAARAAAKVVEAKERARVVASKAAETAGAAKDAAREKLARIFDPEPANWIEESDVVEHWRRVNQVTAQLGGHVPAQLYVDAALATISLLDLLSAHGSLSFARSDMNSNANTLRQHLEAAGADSTLQGLINAELAGEEPFDKLVSDGRTALCSLLWLQRALFLLQVMLSHLEADPRMPVKECLLRAYDASLKRFHGVVGRATFAVAARSSPERRALLANLGPDEAFVFARLRAFLPDIEAVLRVNEEFLVHIGAETKHVEHKL